MSFCRILCSLVFLCLIANTAYAHISYMSAGYGAVTVQSDKTSLLVGVPVTVLKEVDLNGDSLLQPEEIKVGRLKIIEQLQALFKLKIGEDFGTVIDDQLMVSVHVDNKNSTNQIQWLRFLSFPETIQLQPVTLTMDPDLVKLDYMFQVNQFGEHETAVLSSRHPQHVFMNGSWGTFITFMEEGVFHIVTGYDHMLFLLMLLSALIIFRRWLVVLTSFTLAHGVTYGLATFGILYVKPNFIEPVIAFTIVLVAVVHLMHWRPALLIEATGVFSLGLFHGLGFASSMSEISKDLRFPIQSVLGFNMGIELGQVTLACLLWVLIVGLKNIHFLTINTDRLALWIAWISVGIGSYWFIERVDF
jgi:hydrogenase/urease accessory protein HupE